MPSIANLKALQQQPTHPAPDRAEPVVYKEQEQATNIPGRGVVDHGVPVKENFDPELTDTLNEAGSVHYDDAPVGPSPIPVYIVSTESKGRVIHDFRTLYAAVAPAQPSMIAGQHETRSKLRIWNNGANIIYISNDPTSANPMFGYPLDASMSIELATSRAVYASADPTATGNVSVNLLEEFDQVAN